MEIERKSNLQVKKELNKTLKINQTTQNLEALEKQEEVIKIKEIFNIPALKNHKLILFIMKTFKTLSILFYFTLLSLSAQSNDSNQESIQKINTEKSSLKWIGEKITTSQHYGNLKFESGELTFINGIPSSGNFIVDMTSISVEDIKGKGKQRLEGHLKSDDFFSVDKHKKASLLIKGSKKSENGFLVDADLTIKDITHPVQFDMIKNQEGFTANLTFDRSKYNIRFRSGSFFENLGDKLILDDVVLSSKLIF